MSEVDPRFGQPRKTDDPSSELSHASDALFNEWTQDARKTFSSVFQAAEQFSDSTSALMTCALGSESALQHSKEIERSANLAKTNGNDEGAKHLFKRDLAFSMWTLGYDNTQTQSIKSQLDQLENPPQKQTEQNSAQNSGVNSFAEMFKRL
ncbi:MAG: hypothetical protein HYX67_11145 [Candidatus Melainabacteria bacterium]|nr:hypothetical protein [Candidatus Melainabacteria bacterium]